MERTLPEMTNDYVNRLNRTIEDQNFEYDLAQRHRERIRTATLDRVKILVQNAPEIGNMEDNAVKIAQESILKARLQNLKAYEGQLEKMSLTKGFKKWNEKHDKNLKNLSLTWNEEIGNHIK